MTLFRIAKYFFWRSDDRASWYILIIKPTRCTKFSNLFWNKILHVSDSSSVHHQEFFTVHTTMVYAIQVCCVYGEKLVMKRAGSGRSVLTLLASCQQTCITYTIVVCTVKNTWWWTKELSETCRDLFQNKFEKLVHLFGFITGIAKYLPDFKPRLPQYSCIELVVHYKYRLCVKRDASKILILRSIWTTVNYIWEYINKSLTWCKLCSLIYFSAK